MSKEKDFTTRATYGFLVAAFLVLVAGVVAFRLTERSSTWSPEELGFVTNEGEVAP